MKNFKIWAMALLAVLGFASCSEDCDHDFIEYDYSKDLVGTWTCIEPENEFAEALVIKADGTMEVTGIANGEFYETTGTIRVKNNKVSYKQENGDEFEGRFEMVAGETFSLVFDDELDLRFTYHYCKNDLADEVVGMWVCTHSTLVDEGMSINTYQADGKALFTGFVPWGNCYMMNAESTYKVIGDLMIQKLTSDLVEGTSPYMIFRLDYAPDGSEYGDVLTNTSYIVDGGEVIESSVSMIRVKQDLNLVGKKYSYNNVYISNVEGSDKEINFMGYKFAFANMDGSRLEMVMKSALFGIEFPDANTVSYTYQLNGISETYTLPIVVEGNKITFKVSEKVPSLKDVVFYAFQDADDCQLHLYIHQSSFVSFFTNMQAIMAVAVDPAFDITNPAAIDAIYNEIDAAVESINLSVVMK